MHAKIFPIGAVHTLTNPGSVRSIDINELIASVRDAANELAARRAVILGIAARIEPDRGRCEEWFLHEGIARFENRTASEMLSRGLDGPIIAFLYETIRKDRKLGDSRDSRAAGNTRIHVLNTHTTRMSD
jgi:hypothetical protein